MPVPPRRRAPLLDITLNPTTHAGLWLDRFLDDREEPDGAKGRHLKALAAHPMPDGYEVAFALRKQDFEERAAQVSLAAAHAQGRVIIGLGQKGPLEAGLHLEHTWGVPVLPGSALKGLAAATARQLLVDGGWRRGAASFKTLFGDTDECGAVFFHDAWWIPAATMPIHLDVMTVHHPTYYQGAQSVPSDMDSPNPVAFASVTGSYLIAVEGAREWCDAALSILKIGLEELGIGAKTNAGYGRMRLDYQSAEERAGQAAAELAMQMQREQEDRARQKKEMEGMLSRLAPNNAADLLKEGLRKYKGALAQEFAQRMVQGLGSRWLNGKQDKAWVIELLQIAAAANTSA